jgi:hypothetical protein
MSDELSSESWWTEWTQRKGEHREGVTGEGVGGVTGLSLWLEGTWVPDGKEGDGSREKVEPKPR